MSNQSRTRSIIYLLIIYFRSQRIEALPLTLILGNLPVVIRYFVGSISTYHCTSHFWIMFKYSILNITCYNINPRFRTGTRCPSVTFVTPLWGLTHWKGIAMGNIVKSAVAFVVSKYDQQRLQHIWQVIRWIWKPICPLAAVLKKVKEPLTLRKL